METATQPTTQAVVITAKKSIFQITQEALMINELLIESDGELTPELEQALQINQAELEHKAGNYALVIKQNEGEIDMIDAEIKRLQAAKKARENASKRLKEIMIQCMNLYGIKKIQSGTTTLSIRESKAVEILDESLIPNEFKEWKATIKKSLISEALKEGEKVEGAELKTNQSLQIK